MNLRLMTLSEEERTARGEALLPLLERAVTESSLAWSDTPARPGAARRLLARGSEHPCDCLVLAESEGEALGLAASAPFVDPLTEESEPMLVALWVDPRIRHRGVARELVAELRRRLAGRGFPTLTGRVGHTDDALTSMGERWGWVRGWSLMSVE